MPQSKLAHSRTQDATRGAADAIGSIQSTIVTPNTMAGAIAAAVEEPSAVTRAMSAAMRAAAGGVGEITQSLDAIAGSTGRVSEATLSRFRKSAPRFCAKNLRQTRG